MCGLITNPIIISGFGRSGTTWVSDIISKSIGGLILFEPFHPCVFPLSEKYSYRSKLENDSEVFDHLDHSFKSIPNNPWILRNHLPQPIENCSKSYLEYIWLHSKRIGFKTIRMNHVISQLSKFLNAKVLYIYRHPFSVIASINNRKNFWNEFNWHWHYQTFWNRTLIEENFENSVLEKIDIIKRKVTSLEERILLMWFVSLSISLQNLKTCDSFIVCYENLYLHPYEELMKMLSFLNHDHAAIHPSYFFTPSMTTLTTVHPTYDLETLSTEKMDEIFWKGHFSTEQVRLLNQQVEEMKSVDQDAANLIERNYSLPY